MNSQRKILSASLAAEIAQAAREQHLTVGLCHGCFDVLHLGHLFHFESARRQCDLLIISVTPDKYINKGPGRPVFPARERIGLIAGLEVCDMVIENIAESAVEIITLIKPSKFFKGEEYELRAADVNPAFFVERDAVERYGGQVAFTREWTNSSSKAIQKMKGSIEPAAEK